MSVHERLNVACRPKCAYNVSFLKICSFAVFGEYTLNPWDIFFPDYICENKSRVFLFNSGKEVISLL
jgi:hypothetical protein